MGLQSSKNNNTADSAFLHKHDQYVPVKGRAEVGGGSRLEQVKSYSICGVDEFQLLLVRPLEEVCHADALNSSSVVMSAAPPTMAAHAHMV